VKSVAREALPGWIALLIVPHWRGTGRAPMRPARGTAGRDTDAHGRGANLAGVGW